MRAAAKIGANVDEDTKVVISAMFWSGESRQCLTLMGKAPVFISSSEMYPAFTMEPAMS